MRVLNAAVTMHWVELFMKDQKTWKYILDIISLIELLWIFLYYQYAIFIDKQKLDTLQGVL